MRDQSRIWRALDVVDVLFSACWIAQVLCTENMGIGRGNTVLWNAGNGLCVGERRMDGCL